MKALAAVLGVAMLAATMPWGASAGNVLVVPDMFDTIQDAIDAAQPGDTVYARAGVYEERLEVREELTDLVLMGDGIGKTILDGTGDHQRGVLVLADRVTVRDMTFRNYQYTGTFFEEVDGFTMERLEAADNGEYGLFAVRSQHGVVRDSMAHGHRDGGLYIGESLYCFCTVEDNEAYDNVMGYSGTASNFVTIRGNNFHDNRAGLLFSTLPDEPGIQQHSTVVGNWVHHNNNPVPAAPEAGVFYVPVGMGIVVAGGSSNAIAENRVEENDLFGIALFWLFVPPSENQVRGNDLVDNGIDLWWDEWGVNNCFEDNTYASSDPVALPSCQPMVPGLALSNVGIPNLRKDAWLATVGLLQGGQPGTPYQTPLGPVEPLPI